jgi:hypothetical protein
MLGMPPKCRMRGNTWLLFPSVSHQPLTDQIQLARNVTYRGPHTYSPTHTHTHIHTHTYTYTHTHTHIHTHKQNTAGKNIRATGKWPDQCVRWIFKSMLVYCISFKKVCDVCVYVGVTIQDRSQGLVSGCDRNTHARICVWSEHSRVCGCVMRIFKALGVYVCVLWMSKVVYMWCEWSKLCDVMFKGVCVWQTAQHSTMAERENRDGGVENTTVL